MFGNAHFEPWVGSQYTASEIRLLVIGESRYDEEFTDRQIIQERIDGNRHRTFTNFVQAATGIRHWELDYDEPGFWKRVVFFNYNTIFFPGEARIPLPWDERMKAENGRLLREVLQEWKPSHAVAWGSANWESLVVEGMEWPATASIPGYATEPYCALPIDGVTTLFARIFHPSLQGFSYERWHPMLKAFLAMKV